MGLHSMPNRVQVVVVFVMAACCSLFVSVIAADNGQLEQNISLAPSLPSLVVPLASLQSGGFESNQLHTLTDKALESAKPKRRKIVFITAIFGPARPLLPFFIKSAAKSGIDILIFGDSVPELKKLPANVFHVRMEWREMLERVHAKVPECFANSGKGWMQSMNLTRKIIDYKPLYATILEDEIKGYWMWGYGDNDMLLGDVRKFLTDNVTSSYHIIPLHHDSTNHFAWGPATFFRNDPRVNGLFRRRGQLCEMLADRRPYGFDEWYAYGNALDHIIHKELDNGKLGLQAFKWPYPQTYWDAQNTRVYPIKASMVCELWCKGKGPCHTIRQCSAPTRAKCTRVETVLCHFQYTKARLEAKLRIMPQLEYRQLLSSDVIFGSVKSGLYRPSDLEMQQTEARGLSLDG